MTKIKIKGGLINQIAVGKNIRQNLNSANTYAINEFFDELNNLIHTKDNLDLNEKENILKSIEELLQFINRDQINEADITKKTKGIINKAPELKERFKDLITGTASSLLATGVVNAIKLALGV
jgi:hypothetical protein